MKLPILRCSSSSTQIFQIARHYGSRIGILDLLLIGIEQYLLMKINLIQTIITAWLGLIVSCLRLQEEPRVYDPQQYLNSLQQTQTQLRNDLQNIQQQFKKLDYSISAAAYDANEQLRLYQEGIADERDSIYQVQQYLALPFNERACKCFNFSDQLREQLKTQIAAVNQSLSKVEAKANQCVDCQMNIEIGTQIKYQRNYMKIMGDTIDAKCCKIYTILYSDNLNASNWLYGNFTPAQYQAWIDDKIKQATVGDVLIRKCPIYSPYVSSDLKNCTVCQVENELFNLKTRECQKCPSGRIFNYEKHTCDYDIVCPLGSQFNQETISCQKVEAPYNNSMCPPDAPVWNPVILGCFKCSKDAPFYDTNLNKCTACPNDYTYDANTNDCVHKDCQPGQVYNEANKVCETRGGTTSVEFSSSNCPTDRPYWDKSSLSCGRCPISIPFYNTSSKNCQSCPSNSTYDSTRNLCTVQCSGNMQLNPVTLKCQNVTQPTQSDGTQISVCPPSRPIWDPETKSCSQCGTTTPHWNGQTSKCERCPEGYNWNDKTSKCESTTTTISCEDGYKLNLATLKCQKATGVMALCPPEKPFYNSLIMACIQCPADKPNYEYKTNECKTANSNSTPTPAPAPNPQPISCPSGFTYDELAKSCKPNSGTWNVAVCPPQTPLWDTKQGICVSCPAGQQWDSNIKACANCPDATKCNQASTSVPSTNCDVNFEWSFSEGKCVRCLSYQKYNSNTKRCDNLCKQGEIYNSNYDSCSTTVSKCPIGQVFNESKLRCECAQGVNYRYNARSQSCEQFCKSTQYYSYIDEQCHTLSHR